MPRAFTESESRYVREQLLAAGRDAFQRYGVRKTNVAELTRAAGIGKGSFYLFFESKEELFLAIADEVEVAVRAQLEAELTELDEPYDIAHRLIDYCFEVLHENPFLRVMADPVEAESMMRKVGPERLAGRQADDDAFFKRLLRGLRRRGVELDISAPLLGALARGVFALSLQRDMIGEEEFERVRALLVDALATRLSEAT